MKILQLKYKKKNLNVKLKKQNMLQGIHNENNPLNTSIKYWENNTWTRDVENGNTESSRKNIILMIDVGLKQLSPVHLLLDSSLAKRIRMLLPCSSLWLQPCSIQLQCLTKSLLKAKEFHKGVRNYLVILSISVFISVSNETYYREKRSVS